MTNISDDHVKVHFRMDIDEDGWPPASVESLWAMDLGDGTVRLDNTPWFVRGVASDDIIRVEIDDEGIRWAGETVRASENCTIRLIVLKDGGSATARQSVLKIFHKLGTTGEGIERFRMVALDVPPGGGPAADPKPSGTRCGGGLVALGRRVRYRCLEVHGHGLSGRLCSGRAPEVSVSGAVDDRAHDTWFPRSLSISCPAAPASCSRRAVAGSTAPRCAP